MQTAFGHTHTYTHTHTHTHTVREDFLGSPRKECPSFIDYTLQNKMKSAYNTPNVWGIYILNLVLKWVKENGGVEGMSCDPHVIIVSHHLMLVLLYNVILLKKKQTSFFKR